jgi:hypothetical protein
VEWVDAEAIARCVLLLFFHSWCDLYAEVEHLGSVHALQCLCPRFPGASQHGIAQEDAKWVGARTRSMERRRAILVPPTAHRAGPMGLGVGA